MEIKVKCGCGESKCPEWAIVEIQGVIEAQPPGFPNSSSLQIGLLCRPSSQENYTFTVGYHELSGSKVPLKKPYLVIKKVNNSDGDANNTSTNDASTTTTRVELQVIGIVRHRILFKTRPKALISSSQPIAKAKPTAPSTVVPNELA